MSARREEYEQRHVIAPRAATEVQNGVEQLVGEAFGFFGGAGSENLCDEVTGQLAGCRVAHVCQAVGVEDEDVACGQGQMLIRPLATAVEQTHGGAGLPDCTHAAVS